MSFYCSIIQSAKYPPFFDVVKIYTKDISLRGIPFVKFIRSYLRINESSGGACLNARKRVEMDITCHR